MPYTVDVPGINATNAILLDLDNLHDVLGCETITRLFLIDADVGGTLNVMEVLSLAAIGGACDPCDMNCDGDINAFDIEPFLDLLFGGGVPCDTCTGDVDGKRRHRRLRHRTVPGVFVPVAAATPTRVR